MNVRKATINDKEVLCLMNVSGLFGVSMLAVTTGVLFLVVSLQKYGIENSTSLTLDTIFICSIAINFLASYTFCWRVTGGHVRFLGIPVSAVSDYKTTHGTIVIMQGIRAHVMECTFVILLATLGNFFSQCLAIVCAVIYVFYFMSKSETRGLYIWESNAGKEYLSIGLTSSGFMRQTYRIEIAQTKCSNNFGLSPEEEEEYVLAHYGNEEG